MKAAALDSALWPEEALGRLIADLARARSFARLPQKYPAPPRAALQDPALRDRWIEAAADYVGVEAEAVKTPFTDVEQMLEKMAPGVLCLPREGQGAPPRGLLAVCRRRGRWLEVLTPGLARQRVRLGEVAQRLRGDVEAEHAHRLAEWAGALPLSPKARARAYRALCNEVAGGVPVANTWLLRPKPGAALFSQLWHEGVLRRFGLFLLLHALQVGLALLGWSSLFDATLDGALEPSALARWALLSLSAAFVEVVRNTLVGRINTSVGVVLKRRALAGALRLDPDEVSSRGSGGILALIGEAETLETAGVGSLLAITSALISLASAGAVLGRGAAGAGHVALLVAWALVVATALGAMHLRARRLIDLRVSMTNGLVERMAGHRTRMVQERPEDRHRAEDVELERYHSESRRVDRLGRLLQALPSRGWLLAGFVTLLPSLASGATNAASLLVSVGGLFIAQSAFGGISATVKNLLAMGLAWDRAGGIFRAAAEGEPRGLPAAAVQDIGKPGAGAAPRPARGNVVLEARRVSFSYPGPAQSLLSGVSLRVAEGDRILLEGASGSGKSSLAALLAGLRSPDAGLILHYGIDRATLGTAIWRRKVSSVPQFHENRIFSGSLLFNLYMGRGWPASDADRKLAKEVCRELGLGPLLQRMPNGVEQVVGETGWQLSHGERTRVFLARALLQGADVIVVDESFGALDPHTLRTSIDTAFRRARSLMVIAHP